TMRWPRLCLALLTVLAAGRPGAGQQPAPPDDRLPQGAIDGPLVDGRWLRRTLAEFAGAQGTVLFFSTLDCPLVVRYLPRVQQLASDYGRRGVRFLVVDVGYDDGLVEPAAQQIALAPAATFVKDFDGTLARALGVDRTATAVVLDATRAVVYRGRVDGQ